MMIRTAFPVGRPARATSEAPPMRRLGSAGPAITTVGLGSWAIGGPYEFGWGPVDDEESIAAIRHAVEAGVNWVDTAPVYGKGHSEEVVGRALAPFRVGSEVFVFTKCGRNYYGAGDRISSDLRPGTIRRECEESLARLGIERIDLLQFHWPDPQTGTPVEESWAALGTLIDEGKVRWGGVSNFDVSLLERCEAIRHIDSCQPPLNLLNRAARNEVIPWCAKHGVGVIVYAPLASGLLTGSFDRERLDRLPPDDWRRRGAQFQEPGLSRSLAFVERLRVVANRLQISVSALAVAWALAQPGVTGAIVGARAPRQVAGWMPGAGLRLSDATLEEIEGALAASGAGDDSTAARPLSAQATK